MKNNKNHDVAFDICLAVAIALCTLKICGVLNIRWYMIAFPVLCYWAYCILGWLFIVLLINLGEWIEVIFFSHPFREINSAPMYWDSNQKQFWSPEYGLMDYGDTYPVEEDY